jgi:uncharacterized protein DUF4019
VKEETMKKILWVLAAAGICLLAAAALIADQAAAKTGEEAAKMAAEEAAKGWLALVDSGEYGQSWRDAADLFKKQLTVEQWDKAVKSAREPLGKLLSRTVRVAEYTRTLPGAPDGEYVVIAYDSSFENKKQAAETVVPLKEKDGVWKVSGYFIK